jgi:hypothetical protein
MACKGIVVMMDAPAWQFWVETVAAACASLLNAVQGGNASIAWQAMQVPGFE